MVEFSGGSVLGSRGWNFHRQGGRHIGPGNLFERSKIRLSPRLYFHLGEKRISRGLEIDSGAGQNHIRRSFLVLAENFLGFFLSLPGGSSGSNSAWRRPGSLGSLLRPPRILGYL